MHHPADDLRPSADLLHLRDGRLLEWTSVGPPDGTVLLCHHGTPSGATPLRAMSRATTARGVRLVTAARPGYGRSDRQPGRDVAAVAADAAELLDSLAVDSAYVLGWSGGGPHALACAALLPTRVRGVATIAGVAPFGEPDLDFLAGMGEDNVDEFGAALQGEDALRRLLDSLRPGLVQATGDTIRQELLGLLPAVDLEALTGEFADDLAAGMADALRSGVDGWLDDDLAFTRPWGFPFGALEGMRVDLWQGDQDLMVPFAHGQWLGSRVPGARSHLLAGEGHLSVTVGLVGSILDALLEGPPGGDAGR